MEANNYLQMRNNCQGASARCRSVGDKVMPAGPVCAAVFLGVMYPAYKSGQVVDLRVVSSLLSHVVQSNYSSTSLASARYHCSGRLRRAEGLPLKLRCIQRHAFTDLRTPVAVHVNR